MATFECKVYKVKIEPHPNADLLECAVIGEYKSIIQKNQLTSGDLAVYIPEGAIVPGWLIEKLGLTGKLAGKDKNRVKGIKLRGILSQGLVYPTTTIECDAGDEYTIINDYVELQDGSRHFVFEGTDVTEILGITKYDPPIPTSMSGEVFNAFGCTLKYDIENWKKYPDVIQENEEVVITEKIHGTWCCFGFHPEHGIIVTSKGLSASGLAFKLNDANKNNLYIRALQSTVINEKNVVERVIAHYTSKVPFYILGEVFGPVQDLKYGQDKVSFRMFDLYLGNPGQGVYQNFSGKEEFAKLFNIDLVPILYTGPFDKQQMIELTDGMETVSGLNTHIREGVVITPITERYDSILGRVILKNVSGDYLTRKGNVTEFN